MSGNDEACPRHDGTRLLDTVDGPQSYSSLVPILALGVEHVMKQLAGLQAAEIRFSFGFIMNLHREAFGKVVPWAGRLRTQQVQIRAHEPPPPHQVASMLRLFADDLEYRVARIDPNDLNLEEIASLFAFCEGRFVHIHPFLDFNGRVSRMLTWALVLRLSLPPATPLVPSEGDSDGRQRLLDALAAYDNGNKTLLEGLWYERLQAGLLSPESPSKH